MAQPAGAALRTEALPSLAAIAWDALGVAPGRQRGALLQRALSCLGDRCGSGEVMVRGALAHPLVVPEAATVLAPWLIASAASKQNKQPAGALRVLAALAAGAPQLLAGAPLHPEIAAVRVSLVEAIAASWSAWVARLHDRKLLTRTAAAWLLATLPGRDAETLALLADLLDEPGGKDALRAQLLLSWATIARRGGVDASERLTAGFDKGAGLERTAAAVAFAASGRIKHVWDHLRHISSEPRDLDDEYNSDVPWVPRILSVQAMAAHQLRWALPKGPAAVVALIHGPSATYIGALVRAIGLHYFAARGRALPAGPSLELFADERDLLEVLVPALVTRAPVAISLAPGLLPDETDVLDQLWQRLR